MDSRPPILVIDPERNRGRLLVRRLEREGFAAVTVGSLAEALDRHPGESEIVLLDLSLMCGPERERLGDVVTRFTPDRVFACPVCGRRLRELAEGHGAPVCCGRAMSDAPPTSVTEREELTRC